MATKTKRLKGASTGFDGSTVFLLEDGTIYEQSQYYYRYKYAYRPKVTVINDRAIVIDGIPKKVRVDRLR